MKIKTVLSKFTTLTVTLAIGISLVIFRNATPTRLSAAQNLDNYAPYTYSGSYYDAIDFTASDGMNGNLRKSLSDLIYPSGFYTYSGSGNSHLSTQLQYADEDPTNSSNMVYLYTRNSVTKNAASSWNREHVWCQSLSNGNWGTDQGGTDILHLRPTYSSVNSSRGNKPYADLNHNGPKYYNDMLYGYADKYNFEPIDSVKGDVARIVMYLWTTYNNTTKPLNILDVFKNYDTLISWHTQDKPDVLEGNRNDYSQTSRQQNRNPFVDHPELAWRIFGDNVSTSVKNACMEAYPSNGGGGDTIEPTGISLNKTSSSLEVGSKLQLRVTLAPEGATGTVSWSSNNSSAASVNSNGLVNANAEGMATITASVGGYSATCVITVSAVNINYGSLSQPLSITDAKEVLDRTGQNATAQPLYIKGIISSNSAYNTDHKNYDEIWLQSEDGSEDQAFELYRAKLDSISGDYSAANSMVGKEVVAYGYGKIIYGTYELCTSNNAPKNPLIKSLAYPKATAISLDTYEAEIEAGDTITLTASLTPVNNSSTVVWESSDENVATVDNGVVTAVDAGRAVITAKLEDNPDIDAECEVVVTNSNNDSLTLAVASSVNIGDTVYLTCNAKWTQYDGPSGTTQDSFGTYAFFDEKPDDAVGALQVCAGNQDDTYALKIKTGDYANKYLGWSGSKNSLKVTDTLDDNSSWTIEIDENGNATITNVDNTDRVIWWNSTDPRFACYVGKTEGNQFKHVQLWIYSVIGPSYYLSSASTYVAIQGTEDSSSSEFTSSASFKDVMEDGDVPTDFKIGDVSFTGALGTHINTVPKYYANGEALRLYVGNTLTFTAPGAISQITLTFTSGSNASVTSDDAEFSSETNTWTCSSSKVVFSVTEKSRISSVSITYEKETVTVTGVSLGFGCSIPKESWNAIAEKWTISDYGIMMVKEATLTNTYGVSSVKDAYDGKYKLSVVNKGSGDTPYEDGDNYLFAAKVNYKNSSGYNGVVCAVPFIVIDDTYYFLNEIRKSVNSAADYLLKNGGSDLSNAALTILKGNYEG